VAALLRLSWYKTNPKNQDLPYSFAFLRSAMDRKPNSPPQEDQTWFLLLHSRTWRQTLTRLGRVIKWTLFTGQNTMSNYLPFVIPTVAEGSHTSHYQIIIISYTFKLASLRVRSLCRSRLTIILCSNSM
jgi:hypothetical protein